MATHADDSDRIDGPGGAGKAPLALDTAGQCCKAKHAGAPDELNGLMLDMFKKVNVKMAFIIMLLFFVLSSDIYIEQLSKWAPDLTVANTLTNAGVFVTSLILAIAYIVLDLLVQGSVI